MPQVLLQLVTLVGVKMWNRKWFASISHRKCLLNTTDFFFCEVTIWISIRLPVRPWTMPQVFDCKFCNLLYHMQSPATGWDSWYILCQLTCYRFKIFVQVQVITEMLDMLKKLDPQKKPRDSRFITFLEGVSCGSMRYKKYNLQINITYASNAKLHPFHLILFSGR